MVRVVVGQTVGGHHTRRTLVHRHPVVYARVARAHTVGHAAWQYGRRHPRGHHGAPQHVQAHLVLHLQQDFLQVVSGVGHERVE